MSAPLISVETLGKRLEQQQDLLIIDCRFNLLDKELGQADYAEGHIPGAFFLDLEKDLSAPVGRHGGRHPLPDTTAFEQKMRLIGLNEGREVVVYDDSRMAYAAHLRWLLRYFGHHPVSILDGGYSAWLEAGGQPDRRQPELTRYGNFVASPGQLPVRHIEEIKSTPAAFTLIDSREPARYEGREEPIDPVAGHIPGAVNVYWQTAVDNKGFFADAEQQARRWQAFNLDRELVVYCGSGVTACMNLLSLEIAGIPASLYPGSWSDWCSWLSEDEITALKNKRPG